MTDEKMLDKVRKLFAQAEGTDNVAEQEAFTAKATELMLTYAIDEAMLQKAGKATSETIIAKDIVIAGYAKAKMNLLANIADAMGAKTVYVANTKRSGWSTVHVTVIGWESDVASIEVLFSSLIMQVSTNMEREAKRNAHVHGRAFKQAFILGFSDEVYRRLLIQRKDAIKTAEDSTPGAALAVIDRSKAVDNDYARRYPRTRRGTGAKASSGTGMAQGREAGSRANLGQTQVNGGRRAIGR